MATFKEPGDPDDADPVYQYLERAPGRGSKLERLNAVLQRLNEKAAEMIAAIKPPKDRGKN